MWLLFKKRSDYKNRHPAISKNVLEMAGQGSHLAHFKTQRVYHIFSKRKTSNQALLSGEL